VQISIARPGELGPAEISAWHAMQRKTASLSNPFLTPEFSIAVDKFRPNARVAVLTDGPQTVGFFPFQKRRLGVGVPIGTGTNDCQGLVHVPGLDWDPRELLRAGQLSVWQFDCLTEGQRPFGRFVTAVAPSPAIDLTEGFAAYQEKLGTRSPRFGKDLARKARKLEREAGDLHYVVDSREPAELRALGAVRGRHPGRRALRPAVRAGARALLSGLRPPLRAAVTWIDPASADDRGDR
jgi:hypothetical protein